MWIILFFDEHIRFKNCAIDEAQQVFWGLLGLDTNLDTRTRFSLYTSLLNIFSWIFKKSQFLVDILPVRNQMLELFPIHKIWVLVLRTRGSVAVQKTLHDFYEFFKAIHFIKENICISLKLVEIIAA